jgi:hypothetical protein
MDHVSSFGDYELPVMHLAPWDEKLAVREGTLHVCGEGCAQKLQSQFMAMCWRTGGGEVVVELAGGRITIHWLSAKRSQLTGHSSGRI